MLKFASKGLQSVTALGKVRDTRSIDYLQAVADLHYLDGPHAYTPMGEVGQPQRV